MNIEKDLKEEFDKRGVNYAQNRCINYIDDSFDSVLDCVENVVNKNCNIQSDSYSESDVRNIALEMKNAAITGLYGAKRWDMQKRLGRIQDKWKLRP